eukprot:552278-Hanusia_phi.AAC.5
MTRQRMSRRKGMRRRGRKLHILPCRMNLLNLQVRLWFSCLLLTLLRHLRSCQEVSDDEQRSGGAGSAGGAEVAREV